MNKIAKLLIGINRPGTTSVLYGWGFNEKGQVGNGTTIDVQQIGVIDTSSSWSQIAAGDLHTIGIKSDGSLWGWGSNIYGQTAKSPTLPSYQIIPERIGSSRWLSAAAGANHTVAIRQDNTLWAWGFNFYGNLGDGTRVYKSSPVQIGTSSWTQVSCGKDTTAAIRSDGTLWMWGIGSLGGLGQLADTEPRSSPVQIGNTTTLGSASATITSITRTLLGTAALTSTTSNTGDDNFLTLSIPWNISFLGVSYNTLYVGTNMYITFGGGSSLYSGLGAGTPALPKIMLYAADRSAQRYYYGVEGVAPNRTYRIKFEGSTGTSGTLGLPTMGYEAVFYESDPAKFDIHMTHLGSTTGVLGIYSASALVQAITTTQLSLTNSISVNTAVTAGGTTPAFSWTQVSVGEYHTAAIRQDGTLWTWGWNAYGQLGENTSTTAHRSSPVQVGTSSWTQVRATRGATLAIDTTSKLWGWGQAGQHGGISVNDRSSPVQIGSDSWVSLGGGGIHVLAIRSDETLWGWGDNRTYQLTVNQPLYSWSQIQTGDVHSVAIRSDGTLWAWGSGILGTGSYYEKRSSPVQIGTSSWKQISAGRDHTVAIRSDDMLFTWGDNVYGQIGDGTVTFTPAPAQLGTDSWIQVSAGRNYTTAVRSDGALFAWGYNAYGQLSDGTVVNKSSPIQIGSSSWTQVDAGWYHVSAIKSDGTLWGWGDNLYGQIGKHDDPTPASTYTYFTGPQNTTDIDPTYAIKHDGTLWAWGGAANDSVSIMYGNGASTYTLRSSPVQIGVKSWTQVVSRGVNEGDRRVFAIDEVGDLYGWGISNFLGFSGTAILGTPTLIASGSWAQVAAGRSHNIALKVDGTLWGWGDNTQWQISSNLSAPLNSYTQIAGSATRVAIRTDGTLWGWGLNTFGEVGDNTTSNKSSPVQLGSANTWTQVAHSLQAGAAINAAGELYTWGYQANGRLGNNTQSTTVGVSNPTLIGTGYAKVSVGFNGMHAIKADGTLWTWGSNDSGVLGIGAPGSVFARSSPVQVGANTWTTVSRGTDATYAIRSDGTLWGWGTNISSYSQPYTFTKLEGSTGYSGSNFSPQWFGISNTGQLLVTGSNYYGQLGLGDTTYRSTLQPLGTSSWSAVASSSSTTLAIRTDGTLWGWGYNYNGQIGDSTVTDRSSPVQVGTANTWIKITTNGGRSRGITSDGALYSWGILSYTEPSSSQTPTPTQLNTGSWAQISVGDSHTLAINDNGKLFSWGGGAAGQTAQGYTHPTSWTQVTQGGGYSMGIAYDGSLWGWGYNTYGNLGTGDVLNRITIPTKVGNSSWAQVAAYSGRTYAIRVDGTLWAWGGDLGFGSIGGTATYRSSPVQVGTDTNWSQITLGSTNAHLIKTDGTLWAFGQLASYGNGQIGGNPYWLSPTQIGTGTWKRVSATSVGGVAIRSDDTLWSWGYFGNYGVIGVGDELPRSSMVQIGSGTWSGVYAGDLHVAAIRADGVLFTWGYGVYGAIGDGSTASRSSPVQIGTAGVYKELLLGNYGTIAVRNDGTLWGWGSVGMQAPGPNTVSVPTQIGTSNTWLRIRSNSSRPSSQQLVIDNSGTLFYSGSPGGGGLGLSSSSRTGTVSFDAFPTLDYPVQIGTSNWTSVFATPSNSFAIRSDGALFAWGLNADGQIGDGTIINRSSPVQIGTSSWTIVSARSRNTYAITSDNRVFSWGFSNSTYRSTLGDGTTVSRSSPVQVSATATNASIVATESLFTAGTDISVVFTGYVGSPTDTNLFGWGQYPAAYNGGTNPSTPIKLLGQAPFPVSIYTPTLVAPGSWTAVSSGGQYAAAIKSDGSLWTWGYNLYGQLGTNIGGTFDWYPLAQVGTSSWTAVSAGTNRTHALRIDGKLYGWGENAEGAVGDGTTVGKSSPVQIGTSDWSYLPQGSFTGTSLSLYNSTGAIRNDGLFAAWGNNFYGQFGTGNTVGSSSPVFHSSGVLTYIPTPTQLGTANNWVEIATGGNHTIARTSSNTVLGWGDNTSGQVIYRASGSAREPFGTAAVYSNSAPVRARSISASDTATYAIDDSIGLLYAWGQRYPGSYILNPTNLSLLASNGSVISLQWNSYKVGQTNGAIGITTGGSVYTGTGYIVNVDSSVYTGTPSKGFIVGSNTFFFTDTSANTSYVIGNNSNGRAGIGRALSIATEEYGVVSYPTALGGIGQLYSSPVQIGTSSWSQVSATMRRTMAISSDGLLYGWGLNKYGEIGDNVGPTTIIARSSPVQIGTSSWLSVSAGAHHTLAISADNKLFSWGYGTLGQLGSNAGLSRSSPVQVGTSSWSFISASSSDSGALNDYFSGAIRSDSILFMWGANDQGPLGDQSIINRSSPVQVGGAPQSTVYSPVQLSANSGWLKVSVGSQDISSNNHGHSFAIKRLE